MPKKPPKGPFFYYMIEYKEKQEKRGRKYPGGLPQVSNECSGFWENMNVSERAYYVDKAKKARNTEQPGERYTSQGLSFKMVDNTKKAALDSAKKKKLTVEQQIDHATLEGSLANQVFVLISFNYFCKTSDGIYSPAEVGLVKFSLADGIIDTYHTLINPGSLPTGMAYEAKLHSENSHKLIPPPCAEGEIMFANIYRDIYDYAYDYDKNELRPLYTSIDEIPTVESILDTFSLEADDKVDVFKICSIRELLYNLKRTTARIGLGQEGFPSEHIAQAMIEKDNYQFYAGLACETHEEMDNIQCSLSIVKRWAYIFADHCPCDLGITLIPGKHLPKDARIPIRKVEVESDDDIDDEDEDGDTFDKRSMASTNTTKYSFSEYSDFTSIGNKKLKGSSMSSAVETQSNASTISNIKEEPGTSKNYWKRVVPTEDAEDSKRNLDFYPFLK